METIAVDMETTMKKCACCGELKPVSEFHKCKASKDGLYSYCKPCSKEKSRETKARNRQANATPPNFQNTQSVNPLASFTPRELIAELRRRGYRGELRFENIIKL